ncbi:MAG: cation transporter [Desulfobulbus propionicus]|nr:MAG: cation transporter [Desulfobulbus propionicus]
MHRYQLENWQHCHEYHVVNEQGEQRTRYVLILTAVTMVVEIIAGSVYGSMALLADGWHMGTHVAAFVIAVFTYYYADKHKNNKRYSFGTGKVNVLGGFTSAIALAVVALLMLIESVQRLFSPQTIHFTEAILVASLGLLVNIGCALLLKGDHHHDHHKNHHHDHNLQSAYFHVLADALTSLLAIVALLAGSVLGWNWLDPVMGVIGAAIIARWACKLLGQTSPILLDASINVDYQDRIQHAIESDSDNKVSDCHIWKIGSNDYAAIISLVTGCPQPTEHYKRLLRGFKSLSHVTIEVNLCNDNCCP